MSRYLWCERNESSASAHGHTDDCYTERPATPPRGVRITEADLYYPEGGLRTNGDLGGLVRKRLVALAIDGAET